MSETRSLRAHVLGVMDKKGRMYKGEEEYLRGLGRENKRIQDVA